MKRFILLILALAILLPAATGVLADDKKKPKDDGKKGGGLFDDPEEEKKGEEKDDKPVPKTFPTKDYRIQMTAADGRWWTHDKNYTENDDKAKVIMKLRFKLPKSTDAFDINLLVQGWEHRLQLEIEGKKVGAANYKTICDVFFEKDEENFKEAKDIEKPKKIQLGKKRWKAYRYAITGMPEWSGGMPIRRVSHFFKYKDKTYHVQVLLTTSSAKNERVTKELENLLKTLEPRPKGKKK